MLKNISKNKWLLIWVIVGFFLIMFDQDISLGRFNPYPVYKTDSGYGLEFQVYSLNYNYGAGCDMDESQEGGFYTGDVYYSLTMDVFPDVLGFILLGIFLKKMSKFSKLFSVASAMAWLGVVIYTFIHVMPFFFNGMVLSYMSFWLAIAMYGIEVIVGYVFVCGVCDTLTGYEHRQARRAIAIAWFTMIVISAAVCVIKWIAVISPALLMVYEILLMGVSILFYYFIIRESDFIVKDKVIGA